MASTPKLLCATGVGRGSPEAETLLAVPAGQRRRLFHRFCSHVDRPGPRSTATSCRGPAWGGAGAGRPPQGSGPLLSPGPQVAIRSEHIRGHSPSCLVSPYPPAWLHLDVLGKQAVFCAWEKDPSPDQRQHRNPCTPWCRRLWAGPGGDGLLWPQLPPVTRDPRGALGHLSGTRCFSGVQALGTQVDDVRSPGPSLGPWRRTLAQSAGPGPTVVLGRHRGLFGDVGVLPSCRVKWVPVRKSVRAGTVASLWAQRHQLPVS